MRIVSWSSVLVVSLVLAPAGWAAEPAPDGVAAKVEAAGAERLVLESFPDTKPWKEATNKESAAGWIREFIPDDQQVEEATSILTAQAFTKLHPASPSVYLKAFFGLVAQHCGRVRVSGPKESSVGGVAIAYAQVYCNRQNGKDFGVTMLIKVIQGADALYLVQWERRTAPTEVPGVMVFKDAEEATSDVQILSRVNRYLVDSVYLCTPGSAEPRCKGEPAK